MASKRPHRGPSDRNVLIYGDTGPREPQGGAEPGATESGDLQAREFGVPQADLPGGVKHLVNKPAIVTPTPDKGEKPADYHKYHGVASDNGQYVTPGTADQVVPPPKAEPAPKFDEAVPVYITAGPGKKRRIRVFTGTGRRALAANGTDGPVRICDRDEHRIQVWFTNESRTGANFAFIGSRADCDQAIANAAVGTGAFPCLGIPGNSGPLNFVTQDELYVCNPLGAGINVSWALETEIESATSEHM